VAARAYLSEVLSRFVSDRKFESPGDTANAAAAENNRIKCVASFVHGRFTSNGLPFKLPFAPKLFIVSPAENRTNRCLMASKMPGKRNSQRVGTRDSIFEAPDMEARGFEVDLFPPQVANFRCPQTVPKGQKHHQSIASPRGLFAASATIRPGIFFLRNGFKWSFCGAASLAG
jgi:hypothetical protein